MAGEEVKVGIHESFADLGPVLPSRVTVHVQARELRDLAQRAVEFSTPGRTLDLAAALLQLDRMRAILGTGEKVMQL